jgi:putative tryptophan/tyrosine transport system substrate-binding protein
VRRLALLLGLAVLLAPLSTDAQQPKKVPRIALICATQCGWMLGGFTQGLSEVGYVDGQNAFVDFRGAGISDDQLSRVAADLVRRKVDIIVAGGSSAAVFAVKNATKTIPIVMVIGDDAVESGLVASLARPGENVTGLAVPYTELVGKQVELLREAVPGVSRVAVLWNPANPAHASAVKKMDALVRSLKVRLEFVEVRGPVPDFESSFSAVARRRAEAILVLPDPMLPRPGQLTLLAIQRRLPSVSTFSEFVSAAGLMAYGPNLTEMVRRSATYVDKILRGAKPAELPVEEPTRYQLVISLTTARALGLTLPQSILLRADQVIR